MAQPPMDAMEYYVNLLNDNDWSWWPFVFLRPPIDVKMDSERVAMISLAYAPVAGILAVLLSIEAEQMLSFSTVVAILMGAPVGFFLMFRSTFAYFWNRRADRLVKTKN